MIVFQTGASGYIGSAVAEALQRHGHTVAGLGASDQTCAVLESRGIRAISGDLYAAPVISEAAREADGVIHLAQAPGDEAAAADRAAVDAILGGLEGTGKPFVYTQGAWDYGDTGDGFATEEWPMHPITAMRWRPEVADLVRSASTREVRTVVIRPANAYGRGGGVPAMFTSSAAERGAAQYVGPGTNVWSMVHVDDLATLYVLAFTGAGAGSVFNGAGEPMYTVRDLAVAASRGQGAGERTESWPLADARQKLGAWADALVLTSRLSAARARRELGWAPRAPSALEDLESGSYVAGRTAERGG
ncbi:MAG: NAD-dependent epimerase/dehydratase family protein [bacterium]|nr:NAD-dependent epimerase/dehydratase family protein [bacterium]